MIPYMDVWGDESHKFSHDAFLLHVMLRCGNPVCPALVLMENKSGLIKDNNTISDLWSLSWSLSLLLCL